MEDKDVKRVISAYEADAITFEALVEKVSLKLVKAESAKRRDGQVRGASDKLSDDDRAEIALAKIAPLARGERELTFEELRWLDIKKYNFSNSTLRGIIKDAWSNKLIEAVRSKRDDYRTFVTDFTDQTAISLQRALRGVVSDVVMLRRTYQEIQNEQLILDRLGIACALELGNRAEFGDSYGIGSGRSSQAFAEGLATIPHAVKQKAYMRATIIALSGRLSPGSKPFFDSEQNAMIAYSHLKKYESFPPNLTFGVPLFGDPATVVRNSSLHPKFKTPKYAVLTVGVLAEGHRIYNAVKAIRKVGNERRAEECAFQNLPMKYYKTLNVICEMCEEHKKKKGTPLVGDISNRLIVIDPSASREVLHHVEKINNNLLTISENKLRKIGRISLIIAGHPKAVACGALLTGKARTGVNNYLKLNNIKMLCVDNIAADYLKKLNFN